LTHHELLDVLSLYKEQAWVDWVIFIASVASPIIMAFSAWISWRATKISKEATELNLKMYKRQIEESEKSFLPVFEVHTNTLTSETIEINLINKSSNPISVTNIGYEESLEHFEEKRPSDKEIKMKFLGEFEEHSQIKIWLNYTTLNHKYYSSEIVFRVVERSIVIENQIVKNRNY